MIPAKYTRLLLVLLMIFSILTPAVTFPQEARADAATVFFQDDFSSGVLDPSWQPEIGTASRWTIATDSGNKVLSNTETTEILITNGNVNWTDYSYEAKVKAISGGYPGLLGRVQDKSNFYMFRLTKPGGEKNVELSKRVNGADTILATYPLDPSVNKWYTLKIEFIGSTIRCYVDGTKVIDYYESANSFTSGKIGFRNKWAAFMADDVKVSSIPAKRTAYFDDFESGDISGGWISVAGRFTVVDSLYNGNSSKALQLQNPFQESVLAGGVKALFDDTISAQYIPKDANASAGIVGRLKDADNYYLLRANKPENLLEMVKKVKGTPTVIKSVRFDFQTGAAYTLRLDLLEDSLKGYVNGQELLQVTDNSLTTGQAGVWAYGGLSWLDNVGTAPLSSPGQDSIAVSLNDSQMGRMYEGIGYVSSSGSSKLLMDYPDDQQQDIIDFLFKPNFGASLNHLKLEIGSDANSSSGTEPSHMRSETDFDITRGSGLWLAQKAKAVNPDLMLDALRWGTPKWITNNDQKYVFYKNYLQGAKDTYGLDFDYLGPDQNEGAFDKDYVINKLRPGLNADGFSHVKLVARDAVSDPWGIASEMASNPALYNAIDAIGGHYTFSTSASVQALNKPLWHSEARPPYHTQSFRSSQGPLQDVVKGIMTSYVNGKMTKFEMQPFLEAWYDNVPYNTKGALVADKPWTGHYVVDRGVWLTAHFTQFAKPGWYYVDSASAVGATFNYVTYKKPDTGDYSVVAVNTTAKPQKYMFTVTGGLSKGIVHPWKTTETEDFVQLPAIEPVNGSYSITLEPYSVYSLTTTTGQQKGQAKYANPDEKNFKLPYADTFDTYQNGKQPRYFEDQGGAFEIVDLADQGRTGKGIKQKITPDIKPGDWRGTPDPYTLIGDLEWANYSVSADAFLEGNTAGYVNVAGRVVDSPYSAAPAVGYNLKVSGSGAWELRLGAAVLKSGTIAGFNAAQWHNLKLTFLDDMLTAYVDDVETASYSIPLGGLASGQIALGSGYHFAYFDNLKVEPVSASIPVIVNRLDNEDKSLVYTAEGNGKWEHVWQDYSQWRRTLSKATAGNVISINDRTLGTGLHQFNYTGTWSNNSTESAAFNGDNSWSSVADAGYSVKFNGTQAKIYTAIAPNHGIFAVSVDDGTETIVDLYAPKRSDQSLVYTSPVLPPGEHTLKVRVTGTKNAASTGSAVVADRVDITTSEVNIANVETSFTGTGINLIGVANPGNFKADIYLDGQLKESVDHPITATGSKRVLYRLFGLENGFHTVKIALQSIVSLDAVEILGAPERSGGATAEEVVAQIQSIAAPAANETSMKLPDVMPGFEVAIKSSSDTNVIGLDGTIIPPSSETTVYLVLEVTKTSDGTKAVTASLPVVVPAKSAQRMNAVISGDDHVTAGESFTVTYGLAGVNESIYAEDLTFTYDPEKVEFVSAASVKEGFQLISHKEAPGQVRILAASLGESNAVTKGGDLIAMRWKAKPADESGDTSIALSGATVSNGDGAEIRLDAVSRSIAVARVEKSELNALIIEAQSKHDSASEGSHAGQYPIGSKADLQAAINSAIAVAGNPAATQQQVLAAVTELSASLQAFLDSVITASPGDLNGDDKVTIGDLAIIASHYGKSSADPDWDLCKNADLSGDGKIDIEDLAIMARMILESR